LDSVVRTPPTPPAKVTPFRAILRGPVDIAILDVFNCPAEAKPASRGQFFGYLRKNNYVSNLPWVIRGIAATTYHEQGQTTVGYYLNDVALVEPGFPIGIPDIDTFDLDRVEVLRGPQGTLFGSSTLGGLINYVAKTADPSKFDSSAEALLGGGRNQDGQVNYAVKDMVNVPISDVLAVRVAAIERFDARTCCNCSPLATPVWFRRCRCCTGVSRLCLILSLSGILKTMRNSGGLCHRRSSRRSFATVIGWLLS
jgi:TonB-dependent Receptor Plug Domain